MTSIIGMFLLNIVPGFCMERYPKQTMVAYLFLAAILGVSIVFFHADSSDVNFWDSVLNCSAVIMGLIVGKLLAKKYASME